MIPLSPLSVLSLLASTALGAIVENAQDLPGLTYDFVVIGGNSPSTHSHHIYHDALWQDAYFVGLDRRNCWQCYRQPFDRE